MAKPAGKAGSQRPSAKKVLRTRGVSSVSAEITKEERALIWQLTEEGFSQRDVAQKLSISRTSVTRILSEDPVGLEQVRAILREARAQKWKRSETLGIDEAIEWLELLAATRKQLAEALAIKDQRKRRAKLKELYELLHIIPRVIQATKGSAGESAKQVQLLTGGVTERLGAAINDEDLSPEQLCHRAIGLGREHELPPRLREFAMKIKAGQPALEVTP